jgi:hypothetical protein
VRYFNNIFFSLLLAFSAVSFSCSNDEPHEEPGTIQLTAVRVGTDALDLNNNQNNYDEPIGQGVVIVFSTALNTASAPSAIQLKTLSATVTVSVAFLDNDKTVSLTPDQPLANNTEYTLTIADQLKGAKGETFPGYSVAFKTVAGKIEITSLKIGNNIVSGATRITEVPLNAAMEVQFSKPVDPQTVTASSISVTKTGSVPLNFSFTNQNKTLTITVTQKLRHLTKYTFLITDQVKGVEGELLQTQSKDFYTTTDDLPQMPVISDDALLTLTQQQTFKYFWDFAHPASGMARERNSSGNIVTTGGSGFGIMSIIVGVERNFITRQQGLERLDKILDFLETADRFHGVWPHWIDGNTGDVIPFSSNDNGGDLVETSFLMQGLLTFRQYLKPAEAPEQILINRINALWQSVEWSWYTRGGQNVLYWHWSPDKEWVMNHQIKGYNEALITYFLAAAAPTHTIDASVYHQGWASNGSIKNGKTFYNTVLPLGYDYGGPLFFAHYSFLGLDPRNLTDTYGNYWTQNVNHSSINHAYSAANPKNYVGYSDENWGLTASDNQTGYSAHSPTNDLGVISPTAALSSFPYTPSESMKALKFFYYKLGDRLWGEYGFYDAFNLTEGWTATSYLAIDQGPVVVMIENHRTGLLWNLFMSAPEVQTAMDKLSFTH